MSATTNENSDVGDELRRKIAQLEEQQVAQRWQQSAAARKQTSAADEVARAEEGGQLRQLALAQGAELRELDARNELLTAERDAALQGARRQTALERLCRQLQDDKALALRELQVTQEAHAKLTSETETRFSSTIESVQQQISAGAEERRAVEAENAELREKLRNVGELMTQRDDAVNKIVESVQEENTRLRQLCEAQKQMADEEGQRAETFKEQALALARSEKAVREQLAVYQERFEQFEGALTQSTEAFATFNKQRDVLEKTIATLRKENAVLQKQQAAGSVAALDMAEEVQTLRLALERANMQKDKLAELCRVLRSSGTESDTAGSESAAAAEDEAAAATAAAEEEEAAAAAAAAE